MAAAALSVRARKKHSARPRPAVGLTWHNIPMTSPNPPPARPARLTLVDALRGSALLGLFLLHCVEHFEFGAYPEHRPDWLLALDHRTRDVAFFLFGGKAYAIFAMMFGLSFFLILDRAAQRGLDFRGRFLWRLVVLTAIGYVFGVFYCGEILTLLALLGLPLAFLFKVRTRWLAWLSGLLLLQLPFLWQLGRALLDPAYTPWRPDVWSYYRELGDTFAHEGLGAVLKVNLWTGVMARWTWSIENGRYLQMFGLFLWGLLLGRSRIFEDRERCVRLARRLLLVGGAAFVVLFALRYAHAGWGLPEVQRNLVGRLLSSYGNLSQLVVWSSGFVLLFHCTPLRRALEFLAPYGRTSLTNYITQSLVGMTLFYHFGFGLFRHLGEFYSVLGGLAVFVLQCALSHLWLRYFLYGPFEWLWRSLTFLSTKTPLRKPRRAIGSPQAATASAVI